MHTIKANRTPVIILVFMFLVGCTEKPITLDDYYLESWTALEAFINGNNHYIPANKEIAIATQKDKTELKIIASGISPDGKIIFHLGFPTKLIFKNSPYLRGANKEFEALKRCLDKFNSGSSEMGTCSASDQVMNGEQGSVVSDRQHAPHMDVWICNIE